MAAIKLSFKNESSRVVYASDARSTAMSCVTPQPVDCLAENALSAGVESMQSIGHGCFATGVERSEIEHVEDDAW